jgi:hypothetical protein
MPNIGGQFYFFVFHPSLNFQALSLEPLRGAKCKKIAFTFFEIPEFGAQEL